MVFLFVWLLMLDFLFLGFIIYKLFVILFILGGGIFFLNVFCCFMIYVLLFFFFIGWMGRNICLIGWVESGSVVWWNKILFGKSLGRMIFVFVKWGKLGVGEGWWEMVGLRI